MLQPLIYSSAVTLILCEGTIMRKKGLEVQTDGYKGEPKGVEKDWGKKWIFFPNTYFFSRHSTYSFFFLRLSWAEIWVERQKNIRETCCFFKLLWRTVCVVISIRLFGTQVNLLRWSWFLLYNISPAPFGVLAWAYWCQEKNATTQPTFSQLCFTLSPWLCK